MKLLLLLLLPVFYFPSIVLANLDCDPLDPRQQVGEKASISINGSAKAVFKAIGGDADYKDVTEREVKNLYHSYPNADKLVLNGKFIYTFCTYLKSATDLDSHEKFSKLMEFMKLIISEPIEAIQTDKKSVISHEKDDLVTELKSCNLRAKKLKCTLKIISLEKDIRLKVYANYSVQGMYSRVILPSGKSIRASEVIFDADSGKKVVAGSMVSSIPMEVVLIFEGIDYIEGNKIALLDVQYNIFSARLKNIVVEKRTR